MIVNVCSVIHSLEVDVPGHWRHRKESSEKRVREDGRTGPQSREVALMNGTAGRLRHVQSTWHPRSAMWPPCARLPNLRGELARRPRREGTVLPSLRGHRVAGDEKD